MINCENLLSLIKQKFNLNEFIIENNNLFRVFSFGKESDKNYIILKNEISTDNELINVRELINNFTDKKFKNSSFVFIAFVTNDFKKEDYTLFNGTSFLHTISYNLTTSKYMYDKNFYYLGSKKIKQLFMELKSLPAKHCLENI